MSLRRRFFNILLSSVILFSGLFANASQGREFIMSCTYGVLAGTLVGAASLAFVDRPGDNLQRVARGASLGLYLGLGLGYYTVYVVPGKIQNEEEQKLDESTDGQPYSKLPKFMVFPLVGEKGIAGVGAIYQIANF